MEWRNGGRLAEEWMKQGNNSNCLAPAKSPNDDWFDFPGNISLLLAIETTPVSAFLIDEAV